MRQLNRWMWIAGAPVLIAGCAVSHEPQAATTSDEALTLTLATRVNIEGILDYGTVVFAENPTTLLEPGDFHGYEFQGKAGGVVTITMKGASCGAPDTVLDLFGPEDANGNRGAHLIENDNTFVYNPCGFPIDPVTTASFGTTTDSTLICLDTTEVITTTGCSLDSQIRSFMLPVDGEYLVVARSANQLGGGHYRLELACDNNACALPGAPTFAGTRIAQADIDRGAFTPAALFDIGDFLFETIYRVQDGMGNGLAAAPANNTLRPNFRPFPNNVHFAAFGAPEAQSCVSCHNVGGDDGAGDLNHNIFQIGDGINRASGVPRNPPPLLGSGLRQRIGEEMTAELQGQLAAGKAQAAATQANITVTLKSKNTNFGSAVARPDGTVDFALLNPGIDSDLVVKPFGWKGREATIRRFIEGGFRVHFGMQTQPSIVKHCATPNVNTFGTGANCQDPDGDGVTNEITEGQLSAEAVYMGLRETPVRVPAATAAAQTRVSQGEALFNQVGCQFCHRQNMTINVPIHVEPADTTGGAGIRLNLATDTKDPHPALNADGTMTVEIWSDFKRHNMGTTDCDSKPFNQIGACFFMTPPLWGIRDTAPYLHDGRAPTLLDSVLMHGDGDDVNSVNAFKALTADDQSKIVEFMSSLGRQEDKDATAVDLGGFVIEQTNKFLSFVVPAGTLVPHGGYLIVGRNATKTAFQTFYGKTLGTNVVYLNSGSSGPPKLPQINGDETYAMFDSQHLTVDGPTIAQPSSAQRTFGRTRCGTPASVATSWSSNASSAAIATPGGGPLNTGLNFVCLSEIADATDTKMEYIEIFVE
jgi:cytochrome c peroxidase